MSFNVTLGPAAAIIERFSMTFTANVRFTFTFSQNK